MTSHNKIEKFGTFKGVYIPTILTMLGVILFLRIGWVVGNMGLTRTIIIILMSTSITLLTCFSIASLVSNMRVKGGGMYYIISRSLGLESGAAIGIPLYFSQVISIAFCTVGFSESIHSLFDTIPANYIGILTLIVLSLLAYTSANIVIKTQILILLLILSALAFFYLGHPILESQDIKFDKPIQSAGFWLCFAAFYPAVTGIEVGVGMSGNLKKPSRSIPLGIILSLLSASTLYILTAYFLNKFAPRYLLINDILVMGKASILPQTLYAGIWGATLSSVLGLLLSAPRTLQAIASDKIIPNFISNTYGKYQTPRIATLVTFILSAIVIALGSLEAISPILAMFCLTAYGALNFIAGIEGLLAHPSWRPTFKTPWFFSLFGAALCLAAMLMIDPGATIIASLFCFMLYIITFKRKIETSWPDIRNSLFQSLVRYCVFRLEKLNANPKNWRPNILVFSGSPTNRWYLIELAYAITGGKNFLTLVAFIKQNIIDENKIRRLEKLTKNYLRKRAISALVKVKCSENLTQGVENFVINYGLGTIEPNTILLGEPRSEESLHSFSNIISILHKNKKNVLIVKEPLTSIFSTTEKNKTFKIHIWWDNNSRNNGALMYTIAYLISSYKRFLNIQVSIKTIVANQDEKNAIEEQIKSFVDKSRVDATISSHISKLSNDFIENTQLVQRKSNKAHLVFLGLRPLIKNENTPDYHAYLENYFKLISSFPPTVSTLAGQNITFSEIFS